MAYLEKRNEVYRIVFRLNDQKFSRSLRTKSATSAELALAQLNDGLNRLKLGLLELSPGDDVFTALMSTGKVRTQPKVNRAITIGQLCDQYLESIPDNSIEELTRGMLSTHVKHLKRLIGIRVSAANVDLLTLQNYVNARSKEKGIRGKKVSSVTIRKELTTFYAAWNWARESALVPSALPRKARLRYPKLAEKPPFKTWDEITRLISKCKLSEDDQRIHWDCLFLNETQITELLGDVAVAKTPLCVRTMFAVAAFTGMRRSELLRSQVEDIDLDAGKFTIREKKRIRSQHSIRSVPICTPLRDALVSYFDQHPGGPYSFTIDTTPLTRNQAHNYFVGAVRNSRFSVLRGWHVLRHSFISTMASKNIDQRIIDDWVGHQTEAMRR